MSKPAFPVHPIAHDRSDAECDALSGMDLRDYFAAKAMQSIIAALKNITVGVGEETTNLNIAYVSFSIAEAMLKARNAT